MIHSDNGAEIKNQCLEAFLQDKGITHTFFYEVRWTCKVQGYKDGKLFKNLLNLQKKTCEKGIPNRLQWMISYLDDCRNYTNDLFTCREFKRR